MAAPKITLKKIFHDTFSPLMLSHGFKRFKDGYVRVYGEGILQAVTLASFAPNFAIRYACHPYWIFKWRSAGIGDLNNTHWMEEWNVHSFNGEFVSFGEYFKNKPETCYASMKLWLEITEKAILPDLDKIKTIDDYINYVIYCSNTFTAPGGVPRVNQYLLLYKSYLEHSFANSIKYVNEHKQFLLELEDTRGIEVWKKDIEDRIIPSVFGVFLQKVKENDLEWIVKFKEENCAEMRQEIHDILKIDVPEGF